LSLDFKNALEAGILAQKNGKLREAEEIYRSVLRENPDHSDALHLLGTIAFRAGKPSDAVALIRRAIAINPSNPNYFNNCGPPLRMLGRYEEAAASYRECLRLDPCHTEAWYNLGKTFSDAGRPAEAVTAYNRQLELHPNHLSTQWNRSLANLLLGNFQDGWREYEMRWEATPFKRRQFPHPAWSGEDLDGKTLLIHAEQGLGDTIQMLRYATLAADRGARVVVECQPELICLAASTPGVTAVIARGEALPAFDFEIPTMSLPLAFGTTLETIPNKIPYLHAEAERISKWKTRLEKLPPTRKLGLVWAGGEKNPNNAKRSISLSDFNPLAKIPGIEWISLQKGPAAAQSGSAAFSIHDWTNELHDFADTAALVECLDGVVTVDTAVAHLAGALGKPVWILIPMAPDFRWLMDRADSPWYPTARLIRQRTHGAWSDAVENLATELLA
jgi:tetratricopeptide (TPR) repeat protein